MNNEQTLLEKAKQLGVKVKGNKRKSKEEIELALAWVNNQLTLSQIQKVLNLPASSNSYVFLALALKDYLVSKEA